MQKNASKQSRWCSESRLFCKASPSSCTRSLGSDVEIRSFRACRRHLCLRENCSQSAVYKRRASDRGQSARLRSAQAQLQWTWKYPVTRWHWNSRTRSNSSVSIQVAQLHSNLCALDDKLRQHELLVGQRLNYIIEQWSWHCSSPENQKT